MNESEILALWERLLADYGGHRPNPIAMQTWLEDLGEWPADAVAGAYRTWRDEGHDFAPRSGQLRLLLRQAANPAPSFDQVWGAIEGAIDAYGWPGPQRAQRRLSRYPGAWHLVNFLGGWVTLCQGGSDPEHPTPTGVLRGQARAVWADVVARIERGENVDALPVHEPPALRGR